MSIQDPIKVSSKTNRRRSQRAILSLPIMVCTEGGPPDSAFEESTQTLVVNAHGALIAIAGKVEKGQKFQLTNRMTREQLLCSVIYVGSVSGGKTQVGIEFDETSPDFWRITFPHDDWIAPEPEPAVNKGAKY